jgi:hypothetical protein
MRRRRLLLLGLALVGIGAVGLALLRAGPLAPLRWSGNPVADGELIFRTGIGSDGRPVAYGGGSMMLMTCAACHGDRGQGGRVRVMMRTVDVPSITWSELTEAHHDEADTEAAHSPYTEATLRRAITAGVDPADALLDPLMPRWRLTDEEWEAILAFLQTLP